MHNSFGRQNVIETMKIMHADLRGNSCQGDGDGISFFYSVKIPTKVLPPSRCVFVKE